MNIWYKKKIGTHAQKSITNCLNLWLGKILILNKYKNDKFGNMKSIDVKIEDL